MKVECIFFLFSDVVIPESPEAYIKLTENTLKSSSGRKRKAVVWQHEVESMPETQTKTHVLISRKQSATHVHYPLKHTER